MQDCAALEPPTQANPTTDEQKPHTTVPGSPAHQLLIAISSAKRSWEERKIPLLSEGMLGGAPGNLQLQGLPGFSSCTSPRMAAWHFRLVLPLWVLCWEPCALDCDSQISVPNLQLSAHPHCARHALPQHAARPGTQVQFPGTFIRPFDCGNT